MKKLFFTAASAFLFAAASMAQNVPAYVPANGLVGWWPFNGNANDESGNGNNGTVNGATLTQDRFGTPNHSYHFSYFDEISTNFTAIQGPQPRTFSFWMKNQNSNRTITPIWYGGTFPEYPGHVFNIKMNRNEQHDPCGCWPQTYEGAGIDGAWMNLIYSTSIGDNQWHNYIYVVDTANSAFNQLKIYKDGQLISLASNIIFDYNNNSGTIINTANTIPLTLGKSMANPTSLTDTLDRAPTEFLDDIGIWNRALTQQEITNLYNGNICFQNITVTDTLLINMGITSFNPVSYSNTIKIFPNPSHDHITIEYGNYASLNGYQLKIENSLGQQMFQTSINQQTSYISLSTWSGNGLYFVYLIDTQGNTVDIRKIVLQ